MGWLCLAILVWQVVECGWVYPNYLAYFNQLVGGSRNGYRHLVDNNLDWGQELPALHDWLEKNGLNAQERTPVYLSYKGVGGPRYYGIEATQLEKYILTQVSLTRPFPLRAGVYCISASILASPGGAYPRWTPAMEDLYRRQLGAVNELKKLQVSPRRPLYEKLEEKLALVELARLLAFLRQREPDETVNYAILVFRINDADVKEAMTMPIVEGERAP